MKSLSVCQWWWSSSWSSIPTSNNYYDFLIKRLSSIFDFFSFPFFLFKMEFCQSRRVTFSMENTVSTVVSMRLWMFVQFRIFTNVTKWKFVSSTSASDILHFFIRKFKFVSSTKRRSSDIWYFTFCYDKTLNYKLYIIHI